MKMRYIVGQTPIDGGYLRDLKPPHIGTQSELNAWEAENIMVASNWLYGGAKKRDVVTESFFCKLHKKMFDKTWKWAGEFRRINLNIGVDWLEIRPELKKLCGDVKYQEENNVRTIRDIAIFLHHRLTWIHPFPNGNGRFARLITDYYLYTKGCKPFSWGALSRDSHDVVRKQYISALRAADVGDYRLLQSFVEH